MAGALEFIVSEKSLELLPFRWLLDAFGGRLQGLLDSDINGYFSNMNK
jgi:hypothetical protein